MSDKRKHVQTRSGDFRPPQFTGAPQPLRVAPVAQGKRVSSHPFLSTVADVLQVNVAAPPQEGELELAKTTINSLLQTCNRKSISVLTNIALIMLDRMVLYIAMNSENQHDLAAAAAVFLEHLRVLLSLDNCSEFEVMLQKVWKLEEMQSVLLYQAWMPYRPRPDWFEHFCSLNGLPVVVIIASPDSDVELLKPNRAGILGQYVSYNLPAAMAQRVLKVGGDPLNLMINNWYAAHKPKAVIEAALTGQLDHPGDNLVLPSGKIPQASLEAGKEAQQTVNKAAKADAEKRIQAIANTLAVNERLI